jgi:hypothetical protein
VNPDRRAQVIGAAAAGALILLGSGIGIGWAVSGNGHHRGGVYRMELRPGYFPGGPGGAMTRRFPHGFPGQRQIPRAPVPTPSPTATK